MPQFANTPQVKNNSGEGMVKRYVHQPLTIEHFGLHAQIKPNGKVVITSAGIPSKDNPSELEFDEIEVPASFIFKIATFLKGTRSVVYVPVTEAKDLSPVE
jgi:hypothetical protein